MDPHMFDDAGWMALGCGAVLLMVGIVIGIAVGLLLL